MAEAEGTRLLFDSRASALSNAAAEHPCKAIYITKKVALVRSDRAIEGKVSLKAPGRDEPTDRAYVITRR